MESVKKTPKKLIALLLSFVLLVSAIPVGVFSVFADALDDYTVKLSGYNKSASVTLTQSDDSTVTKIVSVENGKAVFNTFVDDAKTYDLSITDLIGYKNYSKSSITIDSDTYTVDDLEEIDKVTISGKITDENGDDASNVKVAYSAYDGKVTGEAKTGSDGTYSFDAYSNIKYNLTITGKDKYNVRTTTVQETSDKDLGTYQLEVKQFTITTTAGSNGSVDNGVVTVNYGEDAPSIVISADTNYRIDEIKINGSEVSEAVGEESFDISSKIKNIKENYTVTAKFYRPTYEITINYNSNGEVKDNSDNPVSNGGKVILEEGSNAGFTAIPFANYHIGNVEIDGADVEETWGNDYGNYSKNFDDNKSHSVTITFTINTFNVTVTDDGNGTASVEPSTVDYNGQTTLTIVPNSGYDIENVIVTRGTSSSQNITEDVDGNTYTVVIDNITVDTTIDVTFSEINSGSITNALETDYYKITFSKEALSNKISGTTRIVILPNDATAKIEPVSPYYEVKYNSSQPQNGYSGTKTISSSTKLDNIWSKQGISRSNKYKSPTDIQIIIDKTRPQVANIPAMEWNKTGSYTVNGTVTDENTTQNPSSGFDYIVWSKTELSETDIKAETENKTSVTNDGSESSKIKGTYSFTVSGEQNQTYYIYAVDIAGNVSQKNTFAVKIDTTKPTVDSFAFSSSSLNICDFGTFSNGDIFVKITASDTKSEVTTSNSGVKEITFNGETKTATSGSATFTLKAADFATGKAVSATVTDNAGNVSVVTIPNNENSNVKSNNITISDKKADIAITKSTQKPQYDNGSEVWYDGNNAFTVKVDDTFGLKNVLITMNGQTVINDTLDTDSISLKTKTYSINTSENAKDGKNEIEVTVVNVTRSTSSATDEVYIDTTKPDVTGFEFTSKGSSALEKALNFLTFGNFFNEKIEIKVSVKDDNATAGLKEITLYGDEAALDTQPIVDGVATFVVPAEDITDETLHLNKTISAKAMDNVNNQTADFVYPTTTNSSTFENSGLMIETKKPTIGVTFPAAASDKNDATATAGDWYATDIDYNITINDPDSGIRSVEVKINDTVVSTDKDGKNIAEKFNEKDTKTTNLTFRVNTDQATRNDDGSYTVTISVTDNAGNVSETYTKTIYKDIDNPTITDFKFEATGYHNDDKITSANQAPVVETTYGYYFIEDTKVTITSHDIEPTSGIKSITYYTVDKDGGKSEEKTVLVDANNQITFTIPANFKGQIYAKATDNVDNTPDDFVNPNSAIVESPELHETTSSIKYTPAENDVNGKARTTDADGNFLYAANAKVDVEIIDSYSGIRQIDWEIISPYDDKKQAGTVTVDNETNVTSEAKEGYNADCLGDWAKTTEDNLVTKLTNTFTISNNSNNIQIKITLTDRAGNVTKDVIQVISIDKTAPKIAIQMNENDDDAYAGFFKVDRTMDVYVYERNFKAEDFNFVVKRTDDNDSTTSVNIEPKFKKVDETVVDGVECYVYKMSYMLTADGDYDFTVNAKDYSDNKTTDKDVKYSSNKSTDYSKQNDADRAIDNKFTIDQTTPEVTVSYSTDGNASAQNGKYFPAYRTATITVKEHNFTDANNRITYTRTATKDGSNIEVPAVSSWSRSGNTYTATIRYSADGDYTFGIDVIDKAGNEIKDEQVSYPDGREVSKDFTIDTTINKPIIGGVENGKSYKEECIPTINIDDVNYQSSTVQLLRTQTYEINVDVTDQYIKNRPANRVTVSEDTFEKVKENDGIYTFKVSVTDMAGNSASDEVTFTVNRFGSVYRYSDDLVDLKDAYIQSVDGEIVITEYNPDRLVKDSLKVEVTRDGAPLSDVDVKVNPVVNNTVAIGDSGWYQYEYRFANSNFATDGIYTITVASEDEVGNKPESTNDSEILFRVDSTPPEVVSISGLEKAQVNAVEQNVEYSIRDAIGLKEIVVHINSITQEPITDFEDLSNYTGSFVVEEGYQNEVRLVITDLAGNVTDTGSDDFKPEFDFNKIITVSTNIFVLWYSNKPLFWGSIGGVAAAAGLVFFLVAKKRRKNDDEPQPTE